MILIINNFQADLETDLGKLERWENIGLSKTPLNDRYFSQPDLGGAAGNTTYEDRARYRMLLCQKTQTSRNPLSVT